VAKPGAMCGSCDRPGGTFRLRRKKFGYRLSMKEKAGVSLLLLPQMGDMPYQERKRFILPLTEGNRLHQTLILLNYYQGT
jgi:hypothetical protein